MYRFQFKGTDNINQFEELIKVFLQPSEYVIGEPADYIYEYRGDKDDVKRRLYADLADLTGKRPKWGILTGIRPVKLASELALTAEPYKVLTDDYYLHESKAGLTTEILDYQQKQVGKPQTGSLSVYIGIPFCPTRCLYCSFTSNQVSDSEIERYLEALHREIDACGEMIRKGQPAGWQISHQCRAVGFRPKDCDVIFWPDHYQIEALYFGGGTPTTLTAGQLDELLTRTEQAFDLSKIREYTVEAGRPDTITEDKIKVLLDHGVD
ncbi:MAG: hypothetical protein IIY23_05440, partial [Erysipelotrichaceae bacterium]|nr:hypothetical protein [Erysipelotrichaceae bacterium]